MNLKPYTQQLKSLCWHKWYFAKAGMYLGLSWRLIILHDLSKFSPVEFINYARWKYGAKSKRGWAAAWAHHMHRNKHHLEYWIIFWSGDPDFYDDLGKTIASHVTMLPAPSTYVREMVADWMATSKENTGSYDFAIWLRDEGPRRFLHEDTTAYLHKVLSEADYSYSDVQDSYVPGKRFVAWDN